MNIPDIIARKRDGYAFSEAEIEHFVKKLVAGEVSDVQLGAWLMATYMQGLKLEETVPLTRAMVDTGVTLQWPEDWTELCVDKHSTGGVGDKVSLVLAPALAACGMKVPMISGRGLGITGGTLDKLESIPGYRVQLSLEEMREIVSEVGCCIAGQTESLCPADRLMYAARDVTNTVGCLGLIVSSIISKKAAEGINHLVLDVKWGSGCYQESLEQAEHLAEALVQTSASVGVKTVAVISQMESPLGRCVGNSLEVRESLDCLRGGGARDLRELVVLEGGLVLLSSNTVTSLEEGKQRIASVLDSGAAMKKFEQMMKKQGVKACVAEELCQTDSGNNNTVLPTTSSVTSIRAEQSGKVVKVEAATVARLAQALGAGRSHPKDQLDLAAGVELTVEPGDLVSQGQVWALVHHNRDLPPHLLAQLEGSIQITADPECVHLPRVSRIL